MLCANFLTFKATRTHSLSFAIFQRGKLDPSFESPVKSTLFGKTCLKGDFSYVKGGIQQ